MFCGNRRFLLIGKTKIIMLKDKLLILSQRRLNFKVSRCVPYEFEETVAKLEGSEIISLLPQNFFQIKNRISNRLARNTKILFKPGITASLTNNNYEIILVVCQLTRDLPSIYATGLLKNNSKKKICWLEEIWTKDIKHLVGHLHILKMFDYVITSCKDSVETLEKYIGKKIYYLPPGVDSIKFSPYPNYPERSIDLLAIGRKSKNTHNDLLKNIDGKNFFYIYDTLVAKTEFSLLSQHRRLIAEMSKRSCFFLANKAKINRDDETAQQEEIGYRFFEGISSGAILVGDYPKNQEFSKNFDWDNSVIQFNKDDINLFEFLHKLSKEKDLLTNIRINNMINALQRHDWLYRWKTIKKIIDEKETEEMKNRQKLLNKISLNVKNNQKNI